MRSKYRTEIEAAAAEHGLDPKLVEAIVFVESSDNPQAYRLEPTFWARYMAKSPLWRLADPKRWAASYGLMQPLAVVAYELGFRGEPEALYTPEVNLSYGCQKLASLITWAKGFQGPTVDPVRAAIAAYNGGKGGNAPVQPIDPRSGKPFPLRNDFYARRVLKVAQQLLA